MSSVRSPKVVLFILVVWFAISFVTNIIGPMMPVIIEDFDLTLTLAAFLPFSFFLAYGIASIPSGMMIESVGMKRSMLIAFTMNFIGVLSFSLFPQYAVVIASLFVVGIGMAMLQVIINPLMRTAGGEEHFAFFSVMGQLVFGLASFVSPMVFTYIITRLPDSTNSNLLLDSLRKVVPEDLSWVSLYWLFAVTFVVLLVVVWMIRLPEVELKDDERAGNLAVYRELLADRRVILFALGIVCYVGTEQGVANWMSQFLSTYHGVDPETVGAGLVGKFWGLMSVGCVVGLALLKIMDSRTLLKAACVVSAAAVFAALFGSAEVSIAVFPWIGFFISVMFSMVFSLALNSVEVHHGAFSGILCTGIFGGALVPLLIGVAGDFVGLRYAMLINVATLGYLFAIGMWAQPLINNSRISLKELKARFASTGG
jgi:fucose permease